MIFAKSAIFQKVAHFSFVLVIIKLYSWKICKLKIPTKTEKFQNKVIFVTVGCTAGSLRRPEANTQPYKINYSSPLCFSH